MQTLHVLTYNIHKGFAQFKRRVSLHDLKDRLGCLPRNKSHELSFVRDEQRIEAEDLTGSAYRIVNWKDALVDLDPEVTP